MIKLLEQFLNKHNINLVNENICIGISTGVDSTVLLHSLLNLKKKINFNLILCHVNHGKREQSNIEEQYIIDFSKENNLILEVLHLNLTEIEEDNFQSAARIKRLEFFNDVMNKYNSNYLFLAHHLNDDIETSLMHIIRGSNLKGYAGISEVVINNNNKLILRPFLNILKDDIVKYAKVNNIKYYEDESNDSDCYTRNRVRHHIIPLLFSENENFSKQFKEFKETLLNSYNIVCEYKDNYIRNNIIINNQEIQLEIDEFKKLSNFMQTEVLFDLLKKYNLSKKNIEEIIKLIYSSKPNITINYKNITFSKQYNRVSISNSININNNKINIIINEIKNYDIDDKHYLEIKKCEKDDINRNNINLKNLNTIWINSSIFPITLRTRKDGDRFKIGNGTRKVKDLLIDEKIPSIDRDKLLLIEANDEILNIFGVKKSKTLLEMKENNIIITLKEKQ